MCGIAGLQLKNPDLYPRLGELVVPMLDVLASRGPDSTGVAVYRRDAPPGEQKYSLVRTRAGLRLGRLCLRAGGRGRRGAGGVPPRAAATG